MAIGCVQIIKSECVESSEHVSITAIDITETSWRSEIFFDVNRLCQTCYRVAGSTGPYLYSNPDVTGNFGGVGGTPHRQRCDDPSILPNTTYEYFSKTSDDNGVTWRQVSCPVEVTTLEPVVLEKTNLGEWGWGTGQVREIQLLDSRTDYHTASVFTCLCTGQYQDFATANRFLRDSDVAFRANAARESGITNEYTIADDAGLGGAAASMLWPTTNANYHWGNPSFTMIVCPITTSPTPTVPSHGDPDLANELGRQSAPYFPLQESNGGGLGFFTLDAPVTLVEGVQYALVALNNHPPVDGTPFLNNPQACQAWIDAGNVGGYWGSNGNSIGTEEDLTGPLLSPHFGSNGGYTLYCRPTDNPNVPTEWRKQRHSISEGLRSCIPFHRYKNINTGLWYGYDYQGLGVHQYRGSRNIEGSSVARQTVVIPANYAVNAGIWVKFFWDNDRVPSGDPMNLELRENGTLIATASFAPNLALAALNRTNQNGTTGFARREGPDWLYSNFKDPNTGANITVNFDNASYEFLFRSNAGSAFWMQSVPVNLADQSPDRDETFLRGVTTQYSSNNGASWGLFPPNPVSNSSSQSIGMQLPNLGQPLIR